MWYVLSLEFEVDARKVKKKLELVKKEHKGKIGKISLPLERIENQAGKIRIKPLYGQYLFVKIPKYEAHQHFYILTKVSGIVSLLPSWDKPLCLSSEEEAILSIKEVKRVKKHKVGDVIEINDIPCLVVSVAGDTVVVEKEILGQKVRWVLKS